jgi:hypothetical protein
MPTRRTPAQDTRGRFLPGNDGGMGRPKGSRNKLGEAFLADLCADWQEHGPAVIARVREQRPQDYLRVVALIMPKDFNVNVNDNLELTDDQLIARIRQLDAAIRPFLATEGDGIAEVGRGKATAH